MAQEQIILHKDQTNIFDFTEDTTKPPVPDIYTSTIQIKTKPPYHKDLFPNVVLIELTKTNYLALIAKDHNTYTTEFYYKKKDGKFNVFYPTRSCKLQKLWEVNHNNWDVDFHFMFEKKVASWHIDYVEYKKQYEDVELAFVENDFDKIFKILASIK
jgi:hypothetical protein